MLLTRYVLHTQIFELFLNRAEQFVKSPSEKEKDGTNVLPGASKCKKDKTGKERMV